MQKRKRDAFSTERCIPDGMPVSAINAIANNAVYAIANNAVYVIANNAVYAIANNAVYTIARSIATKQSIHKLFPRAISYRPTHII
jgi:predicted subunit of tRNA(5-methylaminomethyl-2-thiouridylate) methyltransferase